MRLNKLAMSEVYQEEVDSSVTHQGFTYKLNPLLRLGAMQPTDYLHVSAMAWFLTPERRATLEPRRIAKADLKAPLLVMRHHNKIIPLDGIHRLAKGMDAQRLMLPCKVLSLSDLRDEFRIHS